MKPFVCSCGCEIFTFPPSPTWEPQRQAYEACGLKVDRPTCADCVLEGIRSGEIVTDLALLARHPVGFIR